MKYKATIFKNDEGGDEYIIINEDGSVFKNNLNDNEIIIYQISSVFCPTNRNCIEYNETDKTSRLCKHFTNFFQLTKDLFFYKGLFCNKSKSYHSVSVIKPLNCPVFKNSCLECKYLYNINGIPYPEKSNCHIICMNKLLKNRAVPSVA